MKAKLYIDSDDSTIRVEGSNSEVMNLLAIAIAQILESCYPANFEKQMAWASCLLFATIKVLEDDHDED